MSTINTVGKTWIVVEACEQPDARNPSLESALALATNMAALHTLKAFEVFECVAVLIHEPEVRVITAPEGGTS